MWPMKCLYLEYRHENIPMERRIFAAFAIYQRSQLWKRGKVMMEFVTKKVWFFVKVLQNTIATKLPALWAEKPPLCSHSWPAEICSKNPLSKINQMPQKHWVQFFGFYCSIICTFWYKNQIHLLCDLNCMLIMLLHEYVALHAVWQQQENQI